MVYPIEEKRGNIIKKKRRYSFQNTNEEIQRKIEA